MSRTHKSGTLSRRGLLQASAGFAGGALLPQAFTLPAFAVGEHPPIGTWPAGSKGIRSTIGAAVPRTGAYAVQGEDELKGMAAGSRAHQQRAPVDQEDRTEGQERRAWQAGETALSADCGAKPNNAVQEQQTLHQREQDRSR